MTDSVFSIQAHSALRCHVEQAVKQKDCGQFLEKGFCMKIVYDVLLVEFEIGRF